jgi:hypothetical protein
VLASWPISECYDYPVISASNHKSSLFWSLHDEMGTAYRYGPPQLAKDIPSSLFPFSIFSLFIYKFRYYQTIVSNNPNDKRRNLGWNHSGTIGVTKFVVKVTAQDIKYGGFIEW